MSAQFDPQKWFVVVNPNSGFGKGRKVWPKVEAALKAHGFSFEHSMSEYPADAKKEIIQTIEAGCRKIICVGGDGSLHTMVNAIMEQQTVPSTDIIVGVISLGTGNDWVRTYDFPKKLEAQLAVIQTGKTILQDLGKVIIPMKMECFFINFAGVGYDAYVVKQMGNSKRSGQISYLLGLVGNLFSYESRMLRISLDEVNIEGNMFLAMCCIGRYAAGGMIVAPEANTQDGLFDITAVKNLSKPKVLMKFPKLFTGNILNDPYIDNYKTATAKIFVPEKPEEVYLQADGELIGTGPFHFSVVPKALKVIVP